MYNEKSDVSSSASEISMDFVDALINELAGTEILDDILNLDDHIIMQLESIQGDVDFKTIIRSIYNTSDAVIDLFMRFSRQKHAIRLKYFCQAQQIAMKLVAHEDVAVADGAYEEYVIPVRRAINSCVNELLIELDGDVDLCVGHIKSISESLLEDCQEFLDGRVKYSKQDNLSRILEGSDVCAALTITAGGTICITANSIHATTRKNQNQYYHYLDSIMNYLLHNNGDREKIFLNICAERLKQEGKSGLVLSKQLMSHISKELLVDHHGWKDRPINQIMEFLKSAGINPPLIRHHILSAYSILDRVAHDFKRIEETLSMEKKLGFDILTLGKKGLHAEMRILDYLINRVIFNGNNGIEKTYISISKLCCLDCQNVIKILNEAVKAIYGMDNFISYGSTSSRDGHGLQFDKWEKPEFMYRDISSYFAAETREIVAKVRSLYKAAEKSPEDNEDRQDMYATASESDDELAVIEASHAELSEAKHHLEPKEKGKKTKGAGQLSAKMGLLANSQLKLNKKSSVDPSSVRGVQFS